jgi:broad specificity phosphatase PhoE
MNVSAPRLLILMRHGLAENNVQSADYKRRPDSAYSTHSAGLVETGIRQALLSGEYVRGQWGTPDVIYASHYTRSRQTVEHAFPDISFREDPRIAEVRRGIEYLLSDEQKAALFPWEAMRRQREGEHHFRYLNGDSWADVESLDNSFLDSLYLRHGGKFVLVSSHGKTIRLLNKILQNQKSEDVVQNRSDVENGSLTVYAACGGDWPGMRLVDYVVPWQRLAATPAVAPSESRPNGRKSSSRSVVS